jgi:hypothetical protein
VRQRALIKRASCKIFRARWQMTEENANGAKSARCTRSRKVFCTLSSFGVRVVMAFPAEEAEVCARAARPYVSQTATNHPPAIALEWKILSLACALMTMSVPFAQFCISASSLISERVYRTPPVRTPRDKICRLPKKERMITQ